MSHPLCDRYGVKRPLIGAVGWLLMLTLAAGFLIGYSVALL